MTHHEQTRCIAVTGIHGFIGKALCARLPHVRGLDRSREALDRPATLEQFIRDADVIVHLAGVNAGSGYTPPNEVLVTNNVLATAGLLEAIRRYSTKKPHVLFLSSIHVYEKGEKVFREDSKIGPASYYGLTKLTQELLIQEAGRSGILEYTIFRASNIYGAGCRPYYNSAVATFCEKIRRGETIELFGNGESQLDLVHISDVITALCAAIEMPVFRNRIFHLSYGTSVAIKDVVRILGEVSGVVPRTVLVNNAPVVFHVDNSTLRSVLSNHTFLDLPSGLAEAYGTVS